MGSFGGGGEIEETPYEKEVAKISAAKYDYLRPQLQEAEDKYHSRVLEMNDQEEYSRLNKSINVTTGKAFDEASGELTGNMLASGVNPNSGKFQQTLANFGDDAGLASADALNKGQTMQQDQALQGVGNLVAMGEGKSADSLSGMMDVANMSSSYARDKAGSALQKQSNKIGTLGFVAGAGYEMTDDDGG